MLKPNPDGRLSIHYNGIKLAYSTFDEIRHANQGAVTVNKQLGTVLAMLRDHRESRYSKCG